jgi:chromosome segregation ATPase
VDIPDLEDFDLSPRDEAGASPGRNQDASIAEFRSRILASFVKIQKGASAPLSDEIASLRKASKENEDLVNELRKEYREMEALYNAECEKASSLETRLSDLDAEAQELRARSKLTDDLERSQSELAMIAELQRMENLNEKRALKSELEESTRKHDLLIKQLTQQHADKLGEVKQVCQAACFSFFSYFLNAAAEFICLLMSSCSISKGS